MSSAKSRREVYSEATRAALLEAATGMFAARGFARTSLDDVAAATQVTRGAVYHHFDSKQALFEAVLVALEIRTTERVAAAAATRTDPWEGALAGLDEFLDQCCDETYGRLCWQEGPIALGWARWKECEEKYAYGLVEGFLRALAGAGYLEDAPLATTTQLVVSLLGGAGLAIAEADGAQKQRARDDCAMLMRRMLYGLRATTR